MENLFCNIFYSSDLIAFNLLDLTLSCDNVRFGLNDVLLLIRFVIFAFMSSIRKKKWLSLLSSNWFNIDSTSKLAFIIVRDINYDDGKFDFCNWSTRGYFKWYRMNKEYRYSILFSIYSIISYECIDFCTICSWFNMISIKNINNYMFT